MRFPDFARDGWCLEDAEALHRAAPSTFVIPSEQARSTIAVGGFAKLLFRIAVDCAEGEACERMWVVVRHRRGESYVGVLDNEPDCIRENDELWRGTEVPFRPCHVLDVLPEDAESIALANAPPRRPWSG